MGGSGGRDREEKGQEGGMRRGKEERGARRERDEGTRVSEGNMIGRKSK